MIATRPAPQSVRDALQQVDRFNQTLQNFEKEITQLSQLPPTTEAPYPKFNLLQEIYTFNTSTDYLDFFQTVNSVKIAFSKLQTPSNESPQKPYRFDDATWEELESIRTEVTKCSPVRIKLDQITGNAFTHCSINGTFGDIFRKPIGITRPPLFLDKIRQLSNIAKLASGDGQANNGEKIADALDELGIPDPYKHLYCMHLNERNEKIYDPNYGKNAMMGDYKWITNCERLRAIQRTIITVALGGLQKLANDTQQGTKEAIQDTLKILEEMPMSSKDLPMSTDKKNVAHILFEHLFTLQRQAHEKNPKLADPCDLRFGTDFGRYAFSGPTTKVTSDTKIEAVQKVRDVLSITWLMKV